jgi:formate C-acetyltransferase
VDADTYEGVQQGDNGQSMVLGGFDADGNSQFNALSRLCMEASLELGVIDPKINLRVGKNTPDELYALGTKLTRKGLGFPQYCNDDIVIPGLVQLGYAPEDAQDYAVAACWEFTIPGKAMDIPNEDVFNFPLLVSNTIQDKLLECETFEALLSHLADAIAAIRET